MKKLVIRLFAICFASVSLIQLVFVLFKAFNYVDFDWCFTFIPTICALIVLALIFGVAFIAYIIDEKM